MGEAAFVVGVFEMCLRLPRMIIGAQPQVLIDAVWIDDLSRIHLPVRVPDGFEFAESPDQLRPEHFVQKFAACLPIAMLSAEAAAITHAEVRGLLHKGAPLANARRTHQVKADAAM